MVRQIVPLFFTTDIPGTLAYYREKLGFECLETWQDPPVYATAAHRQAFRLEHRSKQGRRLRRQKWEYQSYVQSMGVRCTHSSAACLAESGQRCRPWRHS